MYLDKVNAILLTKQIADSYDGQLSLEISDIQKINYDSSNNIVDETDDNSMYEEYRYIGTSPSNYIYFNCDDNELHADSSWYESHCEKWRIIGLMDTNTTGNNKLVKIIRDSLGDIILDHKDVDIGSSTYSGGSNDWSDSQLMMMLNPSDYLNQGYRVNNGSLVNTSTIHGRNYQVDETTGKVYYTNSDSVTQSVMQMTYNSNLSEWAGGYYNKSANGCKPANVVNGNEYECSSINFSTTGLKDSAKDYIEEIDWKIGTCGISATINSMYTCERGQKSANTTRPTIWKGKIALMYPTDWSLATSLSTETSEGSGTSCKDTNLSNWSSYSSCYNNWVYTGDWQWTFTPINNLGSMILIASNTLSRDTRLGLDVRPTLYLKASTLVTGGSGTSENPYQLML